MNVSTYREGSYVVRSRMLSKRLGWTQGSWYCLNIRLGFLRLYKETVAGKSMIAGKRWKVTGL